MTLHITLHITRMRRAWLSDALWIGALAALAAGLRFHALTAQGLWSDELFSVAALTQAGAGHPWYDYVPKSFPEIRLSDSFLTWKAAENSPPLYEALLWLWSRLFGWSDFAVRSLSAVLGSLAPPLLFVGLRRALGVWPAAAAALVFALSPAAVAYAQEARSYALLMLLSTLAVVRFVQYALAPGAQRAQWGGFQCDVALYVLLGYTHYTGLLLACGLAGMRFLLALWQRRGLREFVWLALLPALLAPWVALNWRAMASAAGGQMAWFHYGWREGWSLMLPQSAEYFLPGTGALPAALALVLLAWWGARAQGAANAVPDAAARPGVTPAAPTTPDLRWLLCSAFVALLALHFAWGVYTFFNAGVWHPRYFAAMLPLVMSLWALLLSLAGRGRWLPSCALLVLCAVGLPTLQALYRGQWKEDYRGASRYIVDNTQGHPLVVATWMSNAAYFNHYLLRFMADAGRGHALTSIGQVEDWQAGVSALCQRPWQAGEQVVLFQHQMHRLYFEMLARHCAGALRWVSGRQFRGLFVDFYEATGAAASPMPEAPLKP